jgi:adenosine deaminase
VRRRVGEVVDVEAVGQVRQRAADVAGDDVEQVLRARREPLGHGVRIIDDIDVAEDGTVKLGRLAAYVRDKRVPLELCPSSNIQTGAAASYAEHPIGLLRRLRFRATVNTDNRLMSGTSMSAEFAHLVETFGYTLDDMQWFTVNAMKSAFIPFDERLAMINDVIKPGYAELRAEWLFR